MAKVTIMNDNRVCDVRNVNLTATAAVTISIKAAVGLAARCKNFDDDVRKIQTALNRFTPLEGGPLEPLVVDGFCGKKTNNAIYHFQQKWQLPADAIVDPGGATIIRLSTGSGRPLDLPFEFAARIPRTLQIIRQAMVVLSLARYFHAAPKLPNSPFSRPGKSEADKVERHFHVSQTSAPVEQIDKINSVYFNMQVAIGHVPQGMILALDEPPDFAMKALMFAPTGGFHTFRFKENHEYLSLASIYICPPARLLTSEGFVYTMIHELAHYVSPVNDQILDKASYPEEAAKYRGLSADASYHNADSYAQFAFEAVSKPDFNLRGGSL